MKALWLLGLAGFTLWQLVAGDLGLFALLLFGIIVGPIFNARWQGEKIAGADGCKVAT